MWMYVDMNRLNMAILIVNDSLLNGIPKKKKSKKSVGQCISDLCKPF